MARSDADKLPVEPSVTRSPGRPRSQKSRKAILEAAGELLKSNGLNGTTVDGIAERAGVSKATIYRWWPNKAAVVTDSFLELTAPDIDFEHTGSSREDLKRQMRKLAQVFAGKNGLTIATLMAEAQWDAAVAKALRSRWIAVRREETRQVLQRGVDCGELRDDLDVEVAIDALYGPIYYRLLVGHLPLEKSFVNELADYVMSGLTPRTLTEHDDLKCL